MGNGKGYIGKSMSVNAYEAYSREERPISKWTKKQILSDISDFLNMEDRKIIGLEKMKKADLMIYLKSTGWHHTGAFFKMTNFYTIDEDYIIENSIELTETEIQEKQRQREDERGNEEKRIRERKRQEEEEKEYFEKNGYSKNSVYAYIQEGKVEYTKRISKRSKQLVYSVKFPKAQLELTEKETKQCLALSYM